MSTAIANIGNFTDDQIEIIRSQVAPEGTTADELAMFLMYCQRTGLDPFSRQIYLSERRAQKDGRWIVSRKPETTIDGFRVIAERSGQYAGQIGPFWCGPDGEWKDVWLGQDFPSAARVGILRHDFKEPVWGVALWVEYVQTKTDGKPNSMWQKMGANQLAKCAESLGLRKAFPRDLSGIYTREEMPAEAHDAKQAQAETAQRRIKELSTPAISPAVITELADSLDRPKQAAPPPERPDHKPTGRISFDALKKIRLVKDELEKLTGSNEAYYSILRSHSYEHANEIATTNEGRMIWKELAARRKEISDNFELIDTLKAHAVRLGEKQFLAIISNHGCAAPDEVLRLHGVGLDALLRELQEAVA